MCALLLVFIKLGSPTCLPGVQGRARGVDPEAEQKSESSEEG